MSIRSCSNRDCGYPETPCLRRDEFYDPEADCPDLRAGGELDVAELFPSEFEDEGELQQARGAGRFWTGLALGSHEALPTLTDNPPVLITVAGREATGKTCLLVAQYLRVANGCPAIFSHRFCGSRTLRLKPRRTDTAATGSHAIPDHAPWDVWSRSVASECAATRACRS